MANGNVHSLPASFLEPVDRLKVLIALRAISAQAGFAMQA